MAKEKGSDYKYIGKRLEHIRKSVVKQSQQEFSESFNHWIGTKALIQGRVSSMESNFSIGKELFLDIVIFLFKKYRVNPLWIILRENENQHVKITNIEGDLHEKRREIGEAAEVIMRSIADIDIILRNNPRD